jgi:hypothetical protein
MFNNFYQYKNSHIFHIDNCDNFERAYFSLSQVERDFSINEIENEIK